MLKESRMTMMVHDDLTKKSSCPQSHLYRYENSKNEIKIYFVCVSMDIIIILTQE